MNTRFRMAWLYFMLQGTGTALWWCAMVASNEARIFFFPPTVGYLSFLLPDLLFFIGGSFACAVAVRTRSSRMHIMMWVTSGGILYATLLTIALCLQTRTALPGALAMSGAAAGTLLCTIALQRRNRT
ncbi:MAG TPA: hypothetical protein VHI13_16390 [Candidatus Kapabacteria bacterium]|nr:hypothetical protein [Candidatus Kapabacteria bacterium]